MRRTHLLALLLSSPLLGCASFEKSYRDFTPEPPPAIVASAPSAEADALVARFYSKDPGDAGRAAAEALARAPGHAGLHEIAAYDALVRGDPHAAFDHFLAAAADRSATAPDVYLWEMRMTAHTTTEHRRAQALLLALARQHPSAAVRQLATFDLARELRMVGEREEAAAWIQTIRFIEPWLVVGSFDNDQGKGLSTQYPPEKDPDPTRAYPGVRLPVHFRPLAAGKLDGALPLGDAMWPSEHAVAYAETFVHAAAGRAVDLRLTTTNAVQIFVNGRLAAADDKIFREEFDNVVARVSLLPGWNRLLIKSAHLGGPWRLAARFTEVAGGVPADLRYAATATELAAGPAPAGSLVSPAGAINKILDPNRKRFLLGRLWAREGHTHRAAWFLEPLLRDAPRNPLVMYFTALAHWENGETGKVLDLLNRGVAQHPEAAGFLVSRGRFYAQRRLHDKAQKDLEAALARNPAARDAGFELASLYGARAWPIDRCQALEQILARWPDSSRALADLGQCKEDRAYIDEGERLLRRAHALAPGQTYILQRLVNVAERRVDHDAAARWIGELRAAQPSSLEYALEEADLLRRQGKTLEAQRLLELATALSPDSPWPYDKLAQLAYEAKRRPDAERWWRLSLERDPDNASLSERIASMSPAAPSVGDRLIPGADEIDAAVRSADHVTVHPGSHLVVLLDDEVTTVNPDGSSKRVVTQVARAVNTEGRDALIHSRLPTHGKVKVLEAYSIKKGGERQEASSVGAGSLRFRSLDVGSIVVEQYVHYTPPPRFLPNEYVEQWKFQSINAQVELSRWRLVTAKDRELNVELRGPVERKSEIVDGQKVWTFATRGAPPLVPEPGMSPAGDALWMAAVSTVKSWDAYVRWENALLGDAFGPSAELDALAKKLTRGAQTPREKIDRLWGYVAHEIRYQQEYEDTIAGVKPHSAGIVLERGYGDCKDKAVLLIRLARVVGIQVRFAVLRTTPFGKVLEKIPNQQFNHAIAYVPKQAGIDEPFFIDATTNGLDIGNMRVDDEGALSLVIDPETGRSEFIPIPYQSPELEFVRHKVTVDLSDPQKAVARDHLEARGSPASGVRIALRSGENAKKYYQNLSDQIFAGTTLISGRAEHDQDLTRPVSVHLDVDISNAVRAEDDRFRFNVPMLFPLSHQAALAARQHPLTLWRGMQSFEMEVDIGEGKQASHLPSDFRVEHACFTIERKTEARGRKISVRESYKNSCARVSPGEYPAFRAAVQKAVAQAQEHIVFGPPEKGKKPLR
jgi:tetratricopeptide (TPR) repeat protein/transglutaminase-like putative cysteine protease